MDSSVEECSVMKGIAQTEEAIKECYERLQSLEKKIDSESISNEKKINIKKELEEVRKRLKTNEDQLTQLHKCNRKSFAFVAAFCFLCFTLYMIYILIQ